MAVDNEIEEEGAAVKKEDGDELPKVSTTTQTHLRLRVCCEENANSIKAKLAAIKGVEVVRVDYKLKKVTVQSSRLAAEEVVAAVAKLHGAVVVEDSREAAMKQSNNEKVARETRVRMAVHDPYQGQILVYTTNDCYERWYESNEAKF